MQVVEHDLVYQTVDETFTFRDITDIHDGSAACDLKKLREVVNEVKNEQNSYWWLGGDTVDAISYQDSKRFDPETIAPWLKICDLSNLADVQTSHVVNELAPIVDTCLGIGYGNHCEAYRLHHDQDVHSIIMQKMYAKKKPKSAAIPSIGYSCLYILRFHKGSIRKGHGADDTIRVFLHHGYFANGNIRQLKDTFIYYDCDWALYGHGHVVGDFAAPFMSATSKDGILTYSDQKSKVAISNGGFLRTLALPDEQAFYTEKRGCKPSILGPVPITYCPGKKKVKYTITP
jgi:hypothetical protein